MEVAHIGCALLVISAFITDIKSMKIPNKLTIPAILCGLIYHIIVNGWSGALFAGKGFITGFIILLIMYWMGAVGAGDVKLFGGIGAWTGILFTIQTLLYSVLFAGAIGIAILLWRRETFSRLREVVRGIAGFFLFKDIAILKNWSKEQIRFPFMLAVLPGIICAYLYAFPN
ncbi:A24 family peptidase [Paenibacillus crassostreae]|uniref:Peptidase A24 n=1 Tax=Paenibacillus crassostreae TaxID=1763538 RepID=A0A167GKH3_9BACL|nr:A24 family peptidase [Paenibacillus crassostreae]AOZ92194.1 prepilin peptidase [Paenibacillus crassostreae]OAB77656.1 peptidase A24 [Paenibacillus crassostreae]